MKRSPERNGDVCSGVTLEKHHCYRSIHLPEVLQYKRLETQDALFAHTEVAKELVLNNSISKTKCDIFYACQ
jgi:hypothetical protein